MNLKNIATSHLGKKVLWSIGALIVFLVILNMGILIGYHKAGFSYRWGDSYYRAFGKHEGGMMMGFSQDRDFINTNGAIGKIVKIEPPTIVVQDRDGTEKIVTINNQTIIRRFRDAISPADLKIGDVVVVFGSPNDNSQVEATLIRILPMPGEMMDAGTSTQTW